MDLIYLLKCFTNFLKFKSIENIENHKMSQSKTDDQDKSVIHNCSINGCSITCFGRPGGCICTVDVYPPYVCSCWCIDDWLNPLTSENRTKIEEAIDKARKDAYKVRFTMDIDHSLSEITKILKIFNAEIEMAESVQDKDVHLKVEKKTIAEIAQELGLTIGKNT
jgi:hypothetical protein